MRVYIFYYFIYVLFFFKNKVKIFVNMIFELEVQEYKKLRYNFFRNIKKRVSCRNIIYIRFFNLSIQ